MKKSGVFFLFGMVMLMTAYALPPLPTPPTSGGSAPPTDTITPTVFITEPSADTLVAITIPFSASASDNTAVTKVEFFVDDVLKTTDTQSPHSFSWDTTNGGTHGCTGPHTHTLAVKAYDAAGNVGMSTVSVNMGNPSYCNGESPPAAQAPQQYTPPQSRIPLTDKDSPHVILLISGGLAILLGALTWKMMRGKHIPDRYGAVRQYIASGLEQGYTKEQLQNTLIKSGWSTEELQEAMTHHP